MLGFKDLYQGNIIENPEEGRVSLPNSDELVLRQARIYKQCGTPMKGGDDRIQVQVLPELAGIPDSEKKDLPKYPPFFAGTFSAGDPGDMVWVLCTPDLLQGYVLGPINIFSEKKDIIKAQAYGYQQIRSYLAKSGAIPLDFDYKDIVVVKCVNVGDPSSALGTKGGLVELYNRKTGDWMILNTTGGVITLQQDRIVMRVGTPGISNPTCFSRVEITPDTVQVHALHFVIDQIGYGRDSKGANVKQTIQLAGASGNHVLYANGETGDCGKGGMGIICSDVITC